MMALDMVFAFYVLATAAHYAVLASAWATAIMLLTGYVTRSYVNDKLMLVPAAIGAFVGTWIAITFFK